MGLREQVNEFKEECFGWEKMKALGRAELPTVDGSGVKSWASLRRNITQLYGEGSVFANNWPKNPVTVLNKELLIINIGILEKFESSQSASADCSVLVVMTTSSGPERLHELCPYSGLPMSRGWTFSFGDYSKAELPKGYRLKTQDAIFQWNEWWTRSHIEIVGDASVSKTPFGENVFLLCRSGNPSLLLEKIMSTPEFFLRF